MVKVGEQGIFISNTAAKKLSPYNLSQFKKTLVLKVLGFTGTIISHAINSNYRAK